MNVRRLSDSPDPKTGRYYLKDYLAHPFYVKPGFLNRWGPEAWFVRAAGAEVPDTRKEQYIPQGYKFEEVGPKNVKNKGAEEMSAIEAQLSIERTAGCPFAFAR